MKKGRERVLYSWPCGNRAARRRTENSRPERLLFFSAATMSSVWFGGTTRAPIGRSRVRRRAPASMTGAEAAYKRSPTQAAESVGPLVRPRDWRGYQPSQEALVSLASVKPPREVFCAGTWDSTQFQVQPERASCCNPCRGPRRGSGGGCNSELGFCGMSGKSGGQSCRPNRRGFKLGSIVVWFGHGVNPRDMRLTRVEGLNQAKASGLLGDRPNRPHPVIELGSQGLFFGADFLKAASTSSCLMRFAGSPRSPRFCSSVPSPIIPRCIMGRALWRPLA